MKAKIKETGEIVNVIDLFDDSTAKIGPNEFVKVSTLDIIDPEQQKTLYSRLEESNYQWNVEIKAFNYTQPKTLAETVNLMLSNNFKNRLKAEYYQLDLRIKALEKALYKRQDLSNVDDKESNALASQADAMLTYQNILKQRILDLGIKL